MIIVIILNFAVRNPGDKRPGGEFGNARENDYVAALDSHSGASASWNFLAIDRKSQQRAQIQIVGNCPRFHFVEISTKFIKPPWPSRAREAFKIFPTRLATKVR